MTDDVIRFFAAWMLTHETADEGLKAAVERGVSGGAEGMSGGADAFVDGLAAMVAEEKDKLKAELAARARGESLATDERSDPALEEIRFEVGEIRGRMDNLESILETILRKLETR